MDRDRTYRNITETNPPHRRRIVWGAIFAASVLAVVTLITLSMLGFGIGIGTIDPMNPQSTTSGLGIGSIIWWTVSNLIALFVGGWVAAKLAGFRGRFESLMHGLVTWGVYTIFTFYIMTSTIGGVLGGIGRTVGDVITTAPEAAGPVLNEVEGFSFEDIESEIKQQSKQLDQQQLKEQAKQTGQDVSKVLSTVSIALAVALVLGAGAAAGGGAAGVSRSENMDSTVPPDTHNRDRTV